MSERGNELAFPATREMASWCPSLTIREYAAIHLAAGTGCGDCEPEARVSMMRAVVECADALIAELERTRK